MKWISAYPDTGGKYLSKEVKGSYQFRMVCIAKKTENAGWQ